MGLKPLTAMKPRRPNFRALQAFEAVARLLSVSRAAEELGITQSAVSHQIRLLSEEVGEKLLARQGRSVALTPAGQRIAKRLKSAFLDIDRAMSEAIGGSRNTIRLAICSSFAPGWLIPRLSGFYQAHPDVDLKLIMYAQDPELTDAVADAFVTIKPMEAGFHSVFICQEQLRAVAAADVAHRFGQDLPLITTDLDPGRHGQDWLALGQQTAASGLDPGDRRWLFASHYVMACDMARLGLGAALVPDFLVEEDLEKGRLVSISDARLPTGDDYYLSVKESRRREPAIDALLRWARRQIARQTANANSDVPPDLAVAHS